MRVHGIEVGFIEGKDMFATCLTERVQRVFEQLTRW